MRLVTIDQNKHYSYILQNLKYLLKCDIKSSKHFEKSDRIKKNYIYIAKPKYSSILMPSIDYYTGDYLIYCNEQNIDFEVTECIECETVDNYFSEMINDLYKIRIGKFDNRITAFCCVDIIFAGVKVSTECHRLTHKRNNV